MRRLDLRFRRAPLWAAALLLAATLCAPATANDGTDDRPALLASETAPEGLAPAGRLLDFAVVPGDGDVQLVLRADGGVAYEVFQLSSPDRLVLDLPGVRADVARKRAEVGANGLVRVRVGQYRNAPDPVARVVLELDRPLGWQVSRDGDILRVRLADVTVPDTTTDGVGARLAAGDGAPAPAPAVAPAPAPEPVAAPAAAQPEPVAPAPSAPAAAPEPEPVRDSAAADTSAAAQRVAEGVDVSAAPQQAVASATDRAGGRDASPSVARTEPQAAAQVASNDASAAPAPAPVPAVDAAASAPEAAPASYTAPAAPRRNTDRPLDVAGTMFAPGQAEAAAPVPATAAAAILQPADFETKTIQDQRRTYTGKAISLNLVDADIRQVFSVFHDLSGLNFVLDPAVAGAVTIVVDEVPWDQALDLILQNNGLEMTLEGNVIRIAPVVKLAQEAAARRQLREAKELEANPVTITRTLSYAKAADVDKVVRDAILSTKGRVIIDQRTNTLIIRDIPDRVDAIDKLLTTLDAETPQVMIEARIVEVSRDYSFDLGIQWGMTAKADPAIGTGTGTPVNKATGDWSLNLPRNASASALSFSFGNVLDSFNLDITLDALETEGYAKRLSSPKIATQNNEPAEIEQGVRFPIVNTTATEIKTEFVSASLRMKVTPQITAEGTVILEVEVANDSPDFVDRSTDTVPAVNTQRAMTKVLIADGGTTVIGGIYTVNEGRSTKGVPWFSKLPGLGWLFRSKSITNKNRELLIFITPRIIKAA